MYDKGVEPAEIRRKVEKEFKEGDKLEDNIDLWLSLAFFQWQIGILDKDVKEKVDIIIDQNVDINLWKELEADTATLKKRSTALKRLRSQLQTDNLKPRQRKKKSRSKDIFKKGECYAFKLKNGNYTACVVIEDIKTPNLVFNLILNTKINQDTLPTIVDVKESMILILPPTQTDNSKYREAVSAYPNVRYTKIIREFEKIGDVEIKNDFNTNYLSYGSAPWHFLIDWPNMYLVDNKNHPKVNLKTKSYLKEEHPLTKAKRPAGFIVLKNWFSK